MKKNLNWIQALRGIAALMVLFFHMHPHWDLVPTLASFTGLMKWFFSGVDIFFVLSGFVIYRSACHTVSTHGLWPFIKKRLLRIYLGYWPVLLLIAFSTVFLYQEDLPRLEKMVFSALLLYPNIWDNWLPPAWSLTMEIYFYVWIALIALLPQRHQVKAIIFAMLFLAVWNIFWFVTERPSVFNGQQPLRYLLTGLGLEFLSGALLAHAYLQGYSFLRRHFIAIPVCIVLASAGLTLGMSSPYFDRVEIMRVASFGILGISALVLVLSLEQTRFSPPSWLVKVGDASYSLYLLHTFLLDASGRLRMNMQIDSSRWMLVFMLALPVVIVLISLIWYRWVENPIMKTVFPAEDHSKKSRASIGVSV